VSPVPILALDVDGVIIEGFTRNRWDETIKNDLGISRGDLAEAFFKPHWHDIMLGRRHMMPVLAEALLEIGSQLPAQDLVDYWHGRDAHVRSDVIEAALRWKERTCGKIVLATNQEHIRARYLWEELGFQNHFDEMIVSCRIGAQKPELDYFKKGDQVIGRLPGQDVIFLDDLIPNIEGAMAYGWQAHHVETCDHAVEILAKV
jgi:putative hydrolase of the HAD superfamily